MRPSLRAVAAAAAVLGLASACGVASTDATPRATLSTPAVAAATSATTALPSRFFAADSPWNTPIDGTAVDPASATMLSDASERVGVNESGTDADDITTEYRRVDDHLYLNTDRWTVPVVSGGVRTRIVCRQIDCGDDVPATLSIPADTNPAPQYDGWFTVLDRSRDAAYDLWRARREPDGSISYQYARKWSLDGQGYAKPGQVSARGSGLPLFAGLITAEELKTGLIKHALAISLPGPASTSFVQPASSTDGNGKAASIPEGARIRLRADVVPSGPVDRKTGKPIPLTAEQRRTADAITQALRTYGAIVVDRAAVPTLYVQEGVATASIDPDELQGLSLDDFDVMSLGTKYTYPLPSVTEGASTP